LDRFKRVDDGALAFLGGGQERNVAADSQACPDFEQPSNSLANQYDAFSRAA
jgi:hypothetical protein